MIVLSRWRWKYWKKDSRKIFKVVVVVFIRILLILLKLNGISLLK